MKRGYERLYKPVSDFELVYIYKEEYITAKQVKKVTKLSWKADPRTKDKILTQPERWVEMKQYGIDVVAVAPLASNHLITTDGEVLQRNTLTAIGNKKLGRAVFQEDGVIYDFYRASLVYLKFIDPKFDVERQECWFLDGDFSNAAIHNLMIKDKSGDSVAARKKAKSKKGTVQRVKDEQEYSY